jgi:hypothetical protein
LRIFLTGGTGFLGRHLVGALAARGDTCIVLSRGGQDPFRHERVRVVQGDPARAGAWTAEIRGADAVINLAGQLIVKPPQRWTPAVRRMLVDSRVATTQAIVAAMRAASPPPLVLLSASAIGYYGSRGDERVDETSAAGTDFLAQLCVTWEATARGAAPGSAVTLLRTGIVLGAGGGALAPLLTPFRLGVGGPWGDGRQWWSWIHIADWVGMVLWALDGKQDGPINLVAPQPVTVNEFAKALGLALHRPAVLRMPAFALRLGLGEAASALLDLQRVHPRRALERGYRFQFPEITAALADVLRQPD